MARLSDARAADGAQISRAYPPMLALAAVYFGPRVNAVLAFCFLLAAMHP
ncbi:hypothetical protein LMG24235_06499 [Paraburkholderia sabiae]|nr:hypothetical protein LMG24235_06499 [Paraburkholderia sabiae]